MSFAAIEVAYDPETRTATCDLDGEAFVWRAPDWYDEEQYSLDHGQLVVQAICDELNHRQLDR